MYVSEYEAEPRERLFQNTRRRQRHYAVILRYAHSGSATRRPSKAINRIARTDGKKKVTEKLAYTRPLMPENYAMRRAGWGGAIRCNVPIGQAGSRDVHHYDFDRFPELNLFVSTDLCPFRARVCRPGSV